MSSETANPKVKLMSNDGKEFTVGQFITTLHSTPELIANHKQTWLLPPALF